VRDTGWFKSTRSGSSNEGCVEVRLTEDSVGVRDSKNVTGPVFRFTSGEWHTFVAAAKNDRFSA
jgi:hypothetical protein